MTPLNPVKKEPSSLKVGIIDLISNRPNRSLWARFMHANFASIMPQIIAVWCQQKGADVYYTSYTGMEELSKELPQKVDYLFVAAFTEAAQLAYAISNYFRSSMETVTILGGPHAKCYPKDAIRYFDYVMGFTHRDMIHDILDDGQPQRPTGIYLSAEAQPTSFPGVRERWPFIQQNLKKTPFLKGVPIIGSTGCAYHCSFCIDARVPYQPLDFEVIREDLQFLLKQFKKPVVGWHDPNFGIRFNDYMELIEEAVPPGSIDFVAESSLSLLSEKHLIRLQKNGFKGILPGIESWFDLANKSRAGKREGWEKMEIVAEHVNLILQYIPYVQANFVLGLDNDRGEEPFVITKKFIDLVPGVFPTFTLLTSFGRAAPANLDYQMNDRIIPFPFHFLNAQRVMNVKPLHYSWPEFYDHLIDLFNHAFSWRAIFRRAQSNRSFNAKITNFGRAVSMSGFPRIKYYQHTRRQLKKDRSLRAFLEGDTEELPTFFMDQLTNELGPFMKWLPKEAVYHNHKAYLEEQPVA